jgi:SAM-dependent methyltransferase
MPDGCLETGRRVRMPSPVKRVVGAAKSAYDVATSTGARRSLALRISRPENLFQPYNDTWPDRYPEVFRLVRDDLAHSDHARVLSFGCSTGDEVFTVRRYLPAATIKGIDISPGNVAECERRRRASGDQGMAFVRGGSTTDEPTDSYDAVLCMAVLRHGDLSYSDVPTCEHRLTFAAFATTVTDLARCVKPGGLLVIENSNFRFCDLDLSARFACVLSVAKPPFNPQCPLFGPDNRRLAVPSYDEVAFRKPA